MNILLDPQIFKGQTFGGISRYYAEVYAYILQANTGHKITCPISYHQNLHLKEKQLLPTKPYHHFISKLQFKGSATLKKHLINDEAITIKKLKQKKADIFIPTYYNPYFLTHLHGTPFVLTVYDMIHELYPQYFADDKTTLAGKKTLIAKANKIIAISQSTKNDIIRIFPNINPNKIEVVYLSHSIHHRHYPAVTNLPQQYLLFVGNRGFYKNFNFMVGALAQYILQANLHIVCVGGHAFTQAEMALLQGLGVQHLVQQLTATDGALSTYYKNAQAFIYPSAYEGFGIPVLEAMACGCPVLLSPVSSLPEVAGEAGVYFEMGNEADLVFQLNKIIKDNNYRASVVAKGFEQEKKFSWANTAKQCLKIYEEALVD